MSNKVITDATLELSRDNISLNNLRTIVAQSRIQNYLPDENRNILDAFKNGYANPEEYLIFLKNERKEQLSKRQNYEPKKLQKDPPDSAEDIKNAMFNYALQITEKLN